MTKKQIELLSDLKEVFVSVYDGCLTIMKFTKEGNKLYNAERTIEVDLETIASNGRSNKGLFKDVMQLVLDSFIVRWHDTPECEDWNWADENCYDLWVSYISDDGVCRARSFRYKYANLADPKSAKRIVAIKNSLSSEAIELSMMTPDMHATEL